jgi:uncharacterized protein YdeI (YjbR/CyaY-like superfamily)
MPNTIAKNPRVDAFFTRAKAWRKEMEALRAIALGCGLTEEMKWGQPCYTLQGKNIAIIGEFKEYCAFMFFKGALLKDPKGVLVQPGTVQAARQIRLTSLQAVAKMKATIRAYVREAVAVEQSGQKVKLRETSDFKMPREFRDRLEHLPALKDAFEALTPGRQRAYLFYFSTAKQSKTREARIEKCLPQMMQGLGLNDE